jgi:hypothetical protein
MKTKTPVWLLLLLTLGLSALPARAESSPQIVPLGNNTYSVTVSATTKFTRNTEKLKVRAIEIATQFCAKEGKQFKLVSADETKSMYLVGDMASTKVTFKALAAGDPELAATPGEYARPAAPPAPPVTADVLTSELTKLDELRKKGLLTDDEFSAAKKKLLDRM